MKSETVEEAAQANPYLNRFTEREIKCYLSGAKFGAQWQQSQPGIKQWVSVDNEIPPENMEVWAINKHGRMRQASWMQYTDQNKDWFEINFTHWQPLPELPNSTTTPESDMVSKEKVLHLIGIFANHLPVNSDWQPAIQECITKIKGL